MRLSQLLQDIVYHGDIQDCEINGITCDSRNVQKGQVFACLQGVQFDGHDFAFVASEKGAVILAQRDLGLPNQIIVQDSHFAYAKAVANFYGNPAKSLKLIGVTGTNGKTTVTNIIKSVLTQLGYKVGLIGTIQNEIGDNILPTDKTTPDPDTFQGLLKKMADEKCDYVVMEVSSHALEQCRLADSHFEIGLFTNLTQDHLDYHQTMENYYQAKKKLFHNCNQGIICIDDEYGLRLAQEISCPHKTFSALREADYQAKDVQMNVNGVQFYIQNGSLSGKIHFCTPGMFSVHNAFAAALCCLALGISFDKVANAIAQSPPVKGRSERIYADDRFTVLCDYAHSPDGLKNILDSIADYKTGRVVALFGCGGNRDKKKRPLMGEVAARNADFLVVTSDNPRTEDPDLIIDDIMQGVEKYDTPYVRITNRKEAISYTITHAEKGDIILLAGKGHEDYQVLGEEKIHFDEREIVSEIIDNFSLTQQAPHTTL